MWSIGVASRTIDEIFFDDRKVFDIAEPAISIRGLTCRYQGQEKPPLDGLDLEVVEGRCMVAMGPSSTGEENTEDT